MGPDRAPELEKFCEDYLTVIKPKLVIASGMYFFSVSLKCMVKLVNYTILSSKLVLCVTPHKSAATLVDPPSKRLQRIASSDPADGMYSKRLQKSTWELQLYFYPTHYRPFLLFLFKCLSL